MLHDGTMEAKIKEIFLGSGLWGYVLEVENLLDTTHKINPATFRLDGTRAVAAQRWELAPRPETAEQKLAQAHKAQGVCSDASKEALISMKQQIEDLKLMIKNDRRVMAVAAFIAIALIMFLFSDTGGQKRRRVKKAPEQRASKMREEETYRDLVVALQNEQELAKQQRKENRDFLVRMQNERNERNKKVDGLLETLVDKIEQIAREVDNLSNTMDASGEQIPLPDPVIQDSPDELETIGGIDPATIEAPPEEPEQTRVSVIAPGDSVTVELLTGVNALTDGTPYPVVFRLSGPIEGPDGSELDVGRSPYNCSSARITVRWASNI